MSKVLLCINVLSLFASMSPVQAQKTLDTRIMAGEEDVKKNN